MFLASQTPRTTPTC